MKDLMEWSKGNPGAMTFLMSLINSVEGIIIIPEIEKSTIRGTDLYVMWSDLCGKDNEKVMELMSNCPADVLADACSRQDYSGREMVAQYIHKQ